ncbi:hypothetical protein SEMRO_2818_G337800.1 [Seminavis robusta]|uniref:Uncharacterized protein n=1 Tax=Seminavis robusta TaxID=568900 RepID=A0A9N8F0H1_9STRA|nr:hypothetical protein SEMRO_2818_G337800.1 [Seminavis robusta]|eukprot:Sro2818_g337800.1 n/a (150) ;mRNA; f:212-661
MFSWNVLAAACESQRGDTAAVVATIEVKTPGNTLNLEGPVSLQQFGDTSLFRICVHPPNEKRNLCTLCLPPDQCWKALKPKKIISSRSRLKAICQVIELPPDHPEGYSQIVLTLPYDGENGLAMFFCESLAFSCSRVGGEVMMSEHGHT